MSLYPPPPPRPSVLRLLHALIVSLILFQTILPSAALAAPTGSPPTTPPTLPPQQAPTEPVEEEIAIAPPLDETPLTDEPFAELLPPVMPDEPGAELIPSLPAAVSFTLDQPVLVTGGKVALTIQVNGDFPTEVKDVSLTLTLPPGVMTDQGETDQVRWAVPASPKQEPFVKTLGLVVTPETVTATGSAFTIQAQLQAPGYQSSDWATTLGVAADRGSDAVVVEKRQGEQGFVLQDQSGFLTLLAPATSMAAGATIRYTELYRWEKVAEIRDTEIRDTTTLSATPTLSQTAPVSATATLSQTGIGWPMTTLSQTRQLSATTPLSQSALVSKQLFLPVVVGGDAVAAAAAVTETTPADLPPTRDSNGVQLYYHWAFEAQQGEEKIHEFAEALHLSLLLSPLVEAGVDPTILELWTRQSEKEAWTVVRSHYDAKTERLTAAVPHFTEFGLGAGLSHHGEILPSTVGYMTDRLTGSASVQEAIETPSGAGGMNPNLSFSYSSMASDDLFLDSGQDYLSQTSGVGMGWGVSGSNNFVVNNGGYSVVLNGMRLNIRYEEGKWRTDPESFYQVYFDDLNQPQPHPVSSWGSWTLIAPDGTKYEFGDANAFTGFSETSPTAVFFETTIPNGSSYYRLAKQWYLRQVTDTLGNYITYHYQAEKGIETGCIDNNWPTADRWYTAAVYPTEIRWGGNIYTGLTPKMKVLFTYDTAVREDYQIDDWGSGDCKQVKFATKDRLQEVTVQVNSGGFKTIRSYELTQSYYTSSPSQKKRLLLNSIKIRGANDGLLRTASFTYQYGDGIAAGPNRIWLKSADNGWGGKIHYIYTSHRPECPTALCGQNTVRGWRAAVTRTVLEDGIGNRRFVDYYYGPTNDQNTEWGRIGIEDTSAQFFGFKETQATYYALAPASTALDAANPGTVIQWDKQESWPGAQDNADPRAGKPKKLEVRLSASGAVVSVTNYNWAAYRRVSGAWQATVKNRETNNGVTTYPIIWVRQESSDTWTAGGAWDGSTFINGNGSGSQTRYLFDNTATYRGYGNTLEVQEYSHSNTETYVTKTDWDNRITNVTNLTQWRRTLTDYFPGPYVTNAPARVRVYAGSSCKSELRYIYDNVNGNYNVAPTAGVLKKTEQATDSCSTTATIGQYDALWNITRLAHDSYGNVIAENRVGTASNGSQNLVIETTYDPTYQIFPIEQAYSSDDTYKETAIYYGVNGLGLSDNKAFWGAMQEHCGVNEICTRQSYDEYGRPHRTWEAVVKGSAWGSDAAANLLRSYTAYGSGGWTRNVVTAWQAPRCNGNFVRKVYDGLGQLIQEQRPQQTWGATVDGCNGGSNSSEVDVNYLYDAFGRQTRASVPVATALTYINRAAIWSQGYTETVYDATGRPARSFAPNDEQTDYGYAGRSTAVFAMGRSGDPNKVVKWQEVDGLGYLKRLRTYTKPYSEGGSVQATIDLSHDVLGNLRTVTHPNSIGTTTIDYDLASRKISMIDPDLGSWSYTYNRQNQLISQTDGRDKTICLYYDGFERLFGKRFPSNSTCPTSGSYQVLYNYDQNHGTNNRSRGQLTYVSNGNFTKWLSYNNKGLLDYETVRILGASEDYTTTYGYDSYLRLNTLKYPDDEIVTTTYNSMGLPRTLTSGGVTLVDGDTNNDDDTTDTYDGANYDAAGRLVQMNFPAGGNLWQTRGYHGWTTTSASYAGDGNGRLYYIHTGTTKGGQDRLNLAYHYDSFGNLVYFHDNTAYHTLTYDEQNRITAAYSTSYGYDHSGRLTSYEGSSQPVNTTFPAHAIKKSGYSYDANGNLVARAGRTLNWDHENRLVSVTGGGLPNESYIYDDDGIRVKKYTNGTGTYDPFPHYEVTGSTITKYYFFGGQRIAMRKGGTLTYLHSDHLGSTVLETNTSGNPTATQQYCAYGRKRTLSNGTTVCGSGNSLATDHTFTGQKLDGTGLQYYNARYYDPAIGTFISPDTLVPDATNVFDYNRYMYASGNPLKFSDPTGHCNAAGGLSGRVLSADSCGGWGAGVAARAAIQLAVDTASAVILANSAVQAVQPHQESVPLPQPTVEVSGVPLQDQTPHTGWLTSFDAPPQQQVLVDPLPTAEKGSNIVYSRDTLRSNMGITDPNLQAHHIIPHSLSTHDLVKLATQAGWDINAAYNGIGLPNNDIDGAEVGVIYHSGNHQNYTNDVTEILDSYYTLARDQGWTATDAANGLMQIIQGLRHTIDNTQSRRLD